jgi:hypothetical protein
MRRGADPPKNFFRRFRSIDGIFTGETSVFLWSQRTQATTGRNGAGTGERLTHAEDEPVYEIISPGHN